ncbi:hypothetical protein BC826DRAFT_1108735 [Russula brevipes]|nr:hypothetical protein BC826DRAFT_1108735 [Russula brevipes]
MLYHLRRPAPVHFGELLLRSVTHLYVPTLSAQPINEVLATDQAEPFRSDRHHDLDLPETGDAEPRWVHDARLGRAAVLRRVESTRSRPRIPAAGRATYGHPARASILLCARLDGNGYHDDAAPATPDARAGAPDPARALSIGAAKNVELLVATAAEEPGPDAVSSDWEGDGTVVEAVHAPRAQHTPAPRHPRPVPQHCHGTVLPASIITLRHRGTLRLPASAIHAYTAALCAARGVFATMQALREAEARGATHVLLRLVAEAALRNTELDSWKEDEWGLDLMTALDALMALTFSSSSRKAGSSCGEKWSSALLERLEGVWSVPDARADANGKGFHTPKGHGTVSNFSLLSRCEFVPVHKSPAKYEAHHAPALPHSNDGPPALDARRLPTRQHPPAQIPTACPALQKSSKARRDFYLDGAPFPSLPFPFHSPSYPSTLLARPLMSERTQQAQQTSQASPRPSNSSSTQSG